MGTGQTAQRTAVSFWPLLPEAGLLIVGVLGAEQAWGAGVAVTAAGGMVVTGAGLLLGSALVSQLGLAASVSVSACVAGLLLPEGTPAATGLVIGGVMGVVLLAFLPLLLLTRAGAGGSDASIYDLLKEIGEHVMLSDSAKRVLFRDREHELLQQTIEGDIESCSFNRALVLCDDLERMLGTSPEAEQLRERVLVARNRQLAAEIQHESDAVMALLESGEWEGADRAAERLRRLYPDSPALHGLQARLATAKGRWKRDLETSFLDAAERGEIELAMDLLRTLDRVLEPGEAEHVRTAAGNVLEQHREVVSTRFKLAVNDHQWATALQVGREIIAEFPNDTMADEVREMMPTLEAKATEQQS